MRYARVGATLGHERQYVAFTACELLDRVIPMAGRHKFLHQRRVHDRATGSDAADCLGEIGHINHPALQQVTNALAGCQQLHRLLYLGVRGQNQDADRGKLRTDLPGSVEALDPIAGRHPNVHDGQVRVLLADQRQYFRGIAGLADDVEPRAVQQTCYALSKQRVVIGQDYALTCFDHYAPMARHCPWMTDSQAAWPLGLDAAMIECVPVLDN